MTVFSTFFKVLKSQIGIIILYTIGSIFLLIFATLYILQIKLEEYIKNPRIKKQKEKKIKSIEKSKPTKIET